MCDLDALVASKPTHRKVRDVWGTRPYFRRTVLPIGLANVSKRLFMASLIRMVFAYPFGTLFRIVFGASLKYGFTGITEIGGPSYREPGILITAGIFNGTTGGGGDSFVGGCGTIFETVT